MLSLNFLCFLYRCQGAERMPNSTRHVALLLRFEHPSITFAALIWTIFQLLDCLLVTFPVLLLYYSLAAKWKDTSSKLVIWYGCRDACWLVSDAIAIFLPELFPLFDYFLRVYIPLTVLRELKAKLCVLFHPWKSSSSFHFYLKSTSPRLLWLAYRCRARFGLSWESPLPSKFHRCSICFCTQFSRYLTLSWLYPLPCCLSYFRDIADGTRRAVFGDNVCPCRVLQPKCWKIRTVSIGA